MRTDILDVEHTTMYNPIIKIDGSRMVECDTFTITLNSTTSEKIGAYHNKNVDGQLQFRQYGTGYHQLLVGVAGDNNGVKSFSPINGGREEFTKTQIDEMLNITKNAVSSTLNDPGFELHTSQILAGTTFAEEQPKKRSLLEALKDRLTDQSRKADEREKRVKELSGQDEWRYKSGGI